MGSGQSIVGTVGIDEYRHGHDRHLLQVAATAPADIRADMLHVGFASFSTTMYHHTFPLYSPSFSGSLLLLFTLRSA